MSFNSIFIATFSVWENGKRTSINGMVDSMLLFFIPKTNVLHLLEGLHPGSSSVITRIEEYNDGQPIKVKTSLISILLSPLLRMQNTSKTQIIFKLRDFLTVIEWGMRAKNKFQYFIGMESIYTLAGILLRKIGIVQYVIYYVSDYSPDRYGKNLFNKIYLYLDRICAQYSDCIWDVSLAMHPARIAAGLNPKKSAPVIWVPNALFPNQITYLPTEKRLPYSLVFAGTLGPENGPDIAIKSIGLLVKKYPNISLHIFGGEEYKRKPLEQLTDDLNLSKHIFFHGLITNAEDLSKMIKKYMIGLAPYRKEKSSVRKFGDATKLRLYMGAGLPTITTDVPPLGKEIFQKGAAFIANDSVDSQIKYIDLLFEDTKQYEEMRKNAIAFAKNNTWENTYKNAFLQMKDYKNR